MAVCSQGSYGSLILIMYMYMYIHTASALFNERGVCSNLLMGKKTKWGHIWKTGSADKWMGGPGMAKFSKWQFLCVFL